MPRGLVSRLFDLSFTEFVTPSLIKIIFVLGIVMAGLSSLLMLISFAATGEAIVILIGLIFAVVIFFFWVVYARVMAEVFLILFRIEENTRNR